MKKDLTPVIDALRLLSVYLVLTSSIYFYNPDEFSGIKTIPIVDSIYFSVNILFTIGYGGITPVTTATQMLACVTILIGFGIRWKLTEAFAYFLDLEERSLVAYARSRGIAGKFHTRANFLDFERGCFRTSFKSVLAIGAVIVSIVTGALGLFFFEEFDWTDSYFLSVVSVTTVGYGIPAFKTLSGRFFASVWLLLSTLAFTRAILFLGRAMTRGAFLRDR